MPRCEIDLNDLGVSGPHAGCSEFAGPEVWPCGRSVDAVLAVKHGPNPFISRSVWKVCWEHAVDMLDPMNQYPGDRVKVIVTTARGERVLGEVAA